jgi:hypothetical protein
MINWEIVKTLKVLEYQIESSTEKINPQQIVSHYETSKN